MKKIIYFLLTASLLTTTYINADDDVADTGIYGQLGFSRFNLDSGRDVESTETGHLGFGLQFNPNWAVEFRYAQKETHQEFFQPNTFDLQAYSGSFVYRVVPRNETSVFIKLGVGYVELSDRPNDTPNGLAGLGVEFRLSQKTSLVAGLDFFKALDDEFTDYNPYIALNMFFGKSNKPAPIVKQAPAPQPVKPSAPKDSDNDGVADLVDQCPDTPAGISVDANGCPLDSDGDGVFDSLDKCPDTPAGAKVDESGCRIMLTEDVSIVLNVQFANNSDAVSGEYHNDIARVADFMQQYPDTRVVIEGHTDDRGAASYNQQLSEKRAKAVMQYLIDNFNIDDRRVSAVGRGEDYPIADNNTAEGRKQNRRVQAEVKTQVTTPQ